MKMIRLGNTDIEVSELCFGALPIGPNQKNVPVDEAAEVIAYALDKGITFIDTAQMYKTYPHIKKAMDKTKIRPVISSKSAAETYKDMEFAINECLEQLSLDYVDIFLLHAARSDTDVFEKRSEALRCMQDYKQKGKIKAIGISTHDCLVTSLSAEKEEIDVIFPIINKNGLGILNGSREEMEAAIEKCFANQKGVFLMKVLAGGNLIKEYADAMEYAQNISIGRASISLGMVQQSEVKMNVNYFDGKDITKSLADLASSHEKQFLIVRGLCKACNKCVDVCHSSAIDLSEGVANIENSKCLRCGYCVGHCPQFAIRMI